MSKTGKAGLALVLVIGAGLITAAALGAFADTDSTQPIVTPAQQPSPDEDLVAAVEKFEPHATDVHCSDDPPFTCTARLNGEQVTYRASAYGDGVYLSRTEGQ